MYVVMVFGMVRSGSETSAHEIKKFRENRNGTSVPAGRAERHFDSATQPTLYTTLQRKAKFIGCYGIAVLTSRRPITLCNRFFLSIRARGTRDTSGDGKLDAEILSRSTFTRQ